MPSKAHSTGPVASRCKKCGKTIWWREKYVPGRSKYEPPFNEPELKVYHRVTCLAEKLVTSALTIPPPEGDEILLDEPPSPAPPGSPAALTDMPWDTKPDLEERVRRLEETTELQTTRIKTLMERLNTQMLELEKAVEKVQRDIMMLIPGRAYTHREGTATRGDTK